jgi:hypothetical protein
MLGQFKWVYAILSPIGGYIADRFSRRHDLFEFVCVVAGDLVDGACDELLGTAVGPGR